MRRRFIKIVGSIAIVLLVAYATCGHINLPGHGNRENKNFEEAVVNHVASHLTNGEEVEFFSKFSCKDYKVNGDVRFSAKVIYFVVSKKGAKDMYIAQVVCNEDKNKILEWKNLVGIKR